MVDAPRTIFLFDFDGTLSPIVPERSRPRLLPSCARLLADLAARPTHVAAVISNRSLEDLAGRAASPGVFLGGNGGTVWRSPAGEIFPPGPEADGRLREIRSEVLPRLAGLARECGADLEDKTWSVAIHTRGADRAAAGILARELPRLAAAHGLAAHRGPEVFEVPLLPGAGKATGIANFCRILDLPDEGVAMFYAGDDASDVPAMEAVLARGGTVVTVGSRPLVPGSLVAADPLELCRRVRLLAGLAPDVPPTQPGNSPGLRGQEER